jgi:hypothetical protein
VAKWEYEVRAISPTWESGSSRGVPDVAEIVESYFNGMGEDGWEFVSFLPQMPLRQTSVEPLSPSSYYAIFKKRKQL